MGIISSHKISALPHHFKTYAGQDYSVRPATNSMPVYMKDVRCTDRELSILECSFRRNLTHTNHLGDVGVKCKKCKILL